MSDKVNYRDVLVFVSTKMVIFVAIIFDYPSMDKATALHRLSEHQPNNQICLLNQEIIDKYLIFDGTEEIR